MGPLDPLLLTDTKPEEIGSGERMSYVIQTTISPLKQIYDFSFGGSSNNLHIHLLTPHQGGDKYG